MNLEEVRALSKNVMMRFAPPLRLTTSQWADKYRRLAPESSAEPGQWQTDRVPYLREPMDVFSEPGVTDATYVFASQSAKTETILNDVGKIIHLDPAPILVMLPTLELAESWSEERFAPMIRETKPIKILISDAKGRDARNTKRQKKFPGGIISIVGANSPASLAMRAIKHVRCDEVDRYPVSAGTEGDPIGIAEVRLSTFKDGTIAKFSSPTDEETSRIWASYLETDQRKFVVPCPNCKKKQTLKWENMHWPEKDYSDVVYVCPDCKAPITENFKHDMLLKGEWIKTNPQAPKNKAGFWISALYSPWVTWAKLAQEFDEAKRSRKAQLMKVFVNTRLAEVWREDIEGFDSHALYMRREKYKVDVPRDVLVMVCGVDVQDDRLEMEVVGYTHDDESFGIEYRVIWGDPAENKVWEELDAFLRGTWEHERGCLFQISCTCIDSRGHHNKKVWDFCARRKHKNIFAIHGVDGENRALVGAPKRPQTGRDRRRCIVFPVGTYEAKTAIYSYLKLTTPGPAYCHFPIKDCYNDDYFKQLTSEVKRTVYKSGYPMKQWILPDGRRNEALDCRVYALAALHILKPNYAAIEERMFQTNRMRDERDNDGGGNNATEREARERRNGPRRGRNKLLG